MAWFWTIIQLLVHLSAYFWSCGMKMLHGIWCKLEDWIKRYLIQTYHRLSQEYFKSYRIAYRVALWLDFEQLSSYLFVYRRLLRAAISKCYMEFYSERPRGAGFRSVNPAERWRENPARALARAGFSQHLECGIHRSESSPEGSFALIPHPVARWAKTTP